MGRNSRFARTASEDDLAQADAASMFAEEEHTANQPAAVTSAATTSTPTTASTLSSSSRPSRRTTCSTVDTTHLPGSGLYTAATTSTTSTTTGAVSATVAPLGPAKRAPRATPTHLPPELPATAREVTDVASLARVVTLLSAVIEKAVHDGKSVTAVNKRLISCAAEEIRRAAHALTRASPAEPQPTTDQPTTTTTPTDATGLGGFKEELVACVRAEITKLKAELVGACPGRPPLDATTAASTSHSYAQALGSRPARKPAATHTAATPPALRVFKPAIIVTAKKEAKTRQEAVTAFRKSISFKECRFAPVQVKPVSGNKLRVEFETSGQRDETLQRLQGSEQVSAELARSLQPLIIVKGIDRDTPAEELVEIISGQNPALGDISDGDLRLKFKRTNRNPKLYNAVFTTRPALFRMITGLGRVCIDHQRVHVEEFSPFIQCFCCLQFGHVKKNCPAQEEVCAFCAGSKHTEATCPARKLDGAVARCLNCANRNANFDSKTDTRHSATSYSCSVLRAMKSRVESRVDYGSVQ